MRDHVQPQGKPLYYLVGFFAMWVIVRFAFVIASTPADDISLNALVPNVIDDRSLRIIASKPPIIREKNSNIAGAANAFDQVIGPYTQNIRSNRSRYSGDIEYWNNPIKNSAHHAAKIPKDLYPLLFLAATTERLTASSNSKRHLLLGTNWQGSTANILTGNGPAMPAGRSSEQKSNLQSNKPSRFSAYAYIFGRSGSGNADSLGARYGGSQTALQAAYRLNPNDKFIIDATARAQTALAQNDSEIAIGARIKPNAAFPIALIAERRFRPTSSDGFALYGAGGESAIPIIADVKLDVYGQAGISTAGRDTLFFDASANAQRPIITSESFTISAGGGAWAGGQRGATRLDVGPTLSVTLSSRERQYRISGDWRERISGNASPNSGPAITLSTNF